MIKEIIKNDLPLELTKDFMIMLFESIFVLYLEQICVKANGNFIIEIL